MRDYSYLCWPPHHFAVSTRTISSGLVAYWLQKNAEERCDARFFLQFIDEQLLLAMNPFCRENPGFVIVMCNCNFENSNSIAAVFLTDNYPADHVQEVVEHV